MIVDVSMVQNYAACQRRWFASSVLGWQRPPTGALVDGIRWHALCAGETVLLPTDPYWMQKGLEEYQNLLATGDYKVLVAEHPLAARLTPRSMLIGRVDAIVEWNGKCWNLQHKSVRSSMPLGRYFEDLGRSWHENAYAWLLEETRARNDDPKLSQLPFGGSLIVLARKLTRGNVLVAQPVPVTARWVVADELWRYVRRMEQLYKMDEALPNRDVCYSAFGHSPCYLLPYCTGRVQMMEQCGVPGDPTGHYDREWKEMMWSRLMMS